MPLKTNQALAAGERPVKVVGFGDSITGVYYHTGGRRAWPEMLGVALARIYPQAKLEIINAGVSGGTTTSGLARMEKDVLAHRPDLAVIMFGMNDVAADNAAAYEMNLRSMVAKCREVGAEVVLCTPNLIMGEDPRRPVERLSAYAEIVRRVGADLSVPVTDCFAAFQAVEGRGGRELALLMSDNIHPNMRGHKLFAELMARTITGEEVSLAGVGPLPGLPHVRGKLAAGESLRVLAMPPYDAWVGPALQALVPGATVEVVRWETAGQSLAQIEKQAKAQGWMAMRSQPDLPKPDLVILAVPATAAASNFERFYRSYTWVLNWSLSFGQAEWDAVAVLPEVAQPQLSAEERERAAWALQVVQGQDIPYLTRPEGSETGAEELFRNWLSQELRP